MLEKKLPIEPKTESVPSIPNILPIILNMPVSAASSIVPINFPIDLTIPMKLVSAFSPNISSTKVPIASNPLPRKLNKMPNTSSKKGTIVVIKKSFSFIRAGNILSLKVFFICVQIGELKNFSRIGRSSNKPPTIKSILNFLTIPMMLFIALPNPSPALSAPPFAKSPIPLPRLPIIDNSLFCRASLSCSSS